jgi:diguanylate cyclase (GGDEF)-like protein
MTMTESEMVPPSGALPELDRVVEAFGDLPTLAPVALRVIELADDEDLSLDQLAKVIGTDAGLAARLLRLVNSAAYSPGREVTNLNRAAVLLGLRTLKMVTLGFTLVAEVSAGSVDCSLIWRRSLATGVLARRLASRLDDDLADDAFVAGLLSNVGKVALASSEDYLAAVDANGPWLSPAIEREAVGFTSDQVSARILADWGLPRLLVDAVGSRGHSGQSGQPTPVGAILQVADAAAMLILAESDDDKARALDTVILAAATHVGMTVGEVERVIEESGPEVDELAGSFDLDTISPIAVDEIVSSAQARLARLSLDVAALLSEEKQRNEELAETNERLAAAASTDALTGLPNRRTFDAFLSNQVASRVRNPRSTTLGLVIFDLDHFKRINDTHGHAIGDEVLQQFGARLLAGCRRGELAARIGGEEFALVLPEVLPHELEGAADRMRVMFGETPVETSAGPVFVTASVGGSYTNHLWADLERQLFEAADAALYTSKNEGRNRVTIVPLN